MSTSSNISLGALRQQAQYRSDLETNPFISDQEWNSYITNSYKELYDILIAAYGNDYSVAPLYQLTLGNSQLYPLPDGTPLYQDINGNTAAKFYKLLGVDLQYSASPSGYVTLKRFELIERNKYAYPNSAINFNGYTNLRYRIEGSNIMFRPAPMAGQFVWLWYAPSPTSLQYILPATTTLNSLTIGLTDTTGLTAGMNVAGSNISDNTTISSVGSSSVVLSQVATSTKSSAILSFWSDSTTIDGISGWEEYVIIDAAIKAIIKQEGDISALGAQKVAIMNRIEGMAEGRDAGQAHHVSDALGANSYGSGDDGWGMGGNGGGGY